MQIAHIQTTSLYKKIIIIFSVLTIILLGLIAYFSFSKTVITVTPNPQKTATTFTISIKKEVAEEEQPQPSSALPGYLLQTTIEDSQTFTNPHRGDEQIEAQATGHVTIYNTWSKEQPLAATTRLLTPEGILFRIKNRVDVPAGGTVENVEVYADKPGATGNIGPTRFTLPGLWPGLQEKIYAESAEPMSGGLREANVITQQNLSEAKKTLIDDLIKKAVTELEQTDEVRNNQDTISEQAVATLILSEKSSAKAGEETATFDLDLTIRVMAVVFKQEQLTARARAQLQEEIADDQQLRDAATATLTLSVQAYDVEKQTASLSVSYSALVVPRLSSPIFNRDKITGKDRQEIQAYFSNFDEVQAVKVKFSPFWVTKAPTLKDHIEIRLQD